MKTVPMKSQFKENDVVEWPEWVRKKEEIIYSMLDKYDKVKTVTKVTKEMKISQICQLTDVFQKNFKKFKIHIFNIHQQYKAI